MTSNTLEVTATPQRASLVTKIASRYCVEPTKMMDTLKATAFKTEKPISNEQMMALLIVADQHGLNPFTREIFAYPDNKGGIVPVVSIDGWARILNQQESYDGMEFVFSDDGSTCTCTIHRKDRSHPTTVTEYLAECKRSTPPWGSHPRRMLRHRAMIQAARIAFGFSFSDPDEAERIAQGYVQPAAGLEAVRAAIADSAQRHQAEGVTLMDPDPETGEMKPLEKQATTKTYAALADEILHATSADTAALLMDQARDMLPADQLEELGKLYTKKWNQA